MPAKIKNTRRNKAAKAQSRAPMPAPQTNADLRAADDTLAARRDTVVTLSRADSPRSRGLSTMEKAIAKEDAKIIARASARALRRGLH